MVNSVARVAEQAPEDYFKKFPQYPNAVVQLLYNRGVHSQDAADGFLKPEYHHLHDPFLFSQMQRACDRIFRAVKSRERIMIHGDYDADGVSGSVILRTVLVKLGASVSVFLPHREKDGYGMNPSTVRYIAEQHCGLIITCDCGISSGQAIDVAASQGIDTIITDHHLIPDTLPNAYAIIHPKVASESYPFQHLSGGGVAFKLAQALLRSVQGPLSEREREITEKWLLDLVAIATVADMVELVGENRVLVAFGLRVIARNRRLGLQYLLRNARVDPAAVTAETISFNIAPRINAAGRMDHANTAYELLIETNASAADKLARLLEQQNAARQRATESMYREAREMVLAESSGLIIAYKPSWSVGLLGLVAGKLSKEFSRPAFVMCHDGQKIVGSGRSPEGVHILSIVESVKDLLISFGGHAQACGLRFDQENFDAVTAGLSASAASLTFEPRDARIIDVDCVLDPREINWEFVEHISQFGPFGVANPEPVFLSRGVMIKSVKNVGSQQSHVQLSIAWSGRTFRAMGFNLASADLRPDTTADIIYTVGMNEWNGTREIQLKLLSCMPHA